LSLISSLACLLPLVLSALFYNKLPDKVATHWDINGIANGYSGKIFAAFGLPLILLGIQILLCFILDNDPKKENHPAQIKIISKWILPVLSMLVQIIIISYALGLSVNVSKITLALVGLLTAVIGVYLPKCKQNYTIGIRLPWTLNSESNWDKTHKLTGRIWTAGGILLAASSLLSLSSLFFTILFIMVIVPAGYSYYLYKNPKQ
jgi:uncharacterized membrane protein